MIRIFKLFRYLKPYRIQIAAILVLLFFQALSELYLPTLMADIVNVGIVKSDTNYIVRIGGLMILIAAIGVSCSISASFLSSRTSMGFGKILRNKVFSKVESFSLNEFDKFGTASLITRTTNDITQVQMVMMFMLRMMVSAPMMCIGGIIMAVSKDAKLSMILIIVLPIMAAAIFIIAKLGIPLFKAIQIKIDKLNLVLRENLTGIRVIRAFNRVKFEEQRFNDANIDLTGTSVKVGRLMALTMPLMMLIMNLTIIAIIWFGSVRIDHGDMQVGDIMAFIQYAMQIMFSLLMVSMMFIMIPRASVSAERINGVIETEPGIKEPEIAKSSGAVKGCVEFKDVTFSYPGAENPAIINISFSTKPGEITAIIGGTGSGKSTLVNLIPRFYDVDSGSVLVDGIDIREMTQEDLRNKIGFVPQKTVLFSGSVYDNIRYGKEDASDEEVAHAAGVAQASEFIGSMEYKFDSLISQGGTNISGGQKQRLSIARALVRKPEIYIFDDSFSALDFKTDAKLRGALKKEIVDSTVFIIAQRVNTVMEADQIIVLDEGRIAGIGPHKELIKTCEVYREIVSSQLGEEETA